MRLPPLFRHRRRESGQAAVEAALTLPLTVFLVLGALQLFLLGQARLMTELAAFRAARTGALSQGYCRRMIHSSILTLLPTFARTNDQDSLVSAFKERNTNRYKPSLDWGHNGDIVWIYRLSPRGTDIPAGADMGWFDDVDEGPTRLEVRLVFWYPMRIPFANWVIARLMLAHMGVDDFRGYDFANPTRPGNWEKGSATHISNTPAGSGLPHSVATEMLNRADNPNGTYVFPLEATAAMRMMTAPRRGFFNNQHCR